MRYAAIRLLRGNVIAYYSICLWTISGAVSNMSLVRDAAFAGKKKALPTAGLRSSGLLRSELLGVSCAVHFDYDAAIRCQACD